MSASPRAASLTERAWAWQRWRSWCNSCEYARNDWRDGSPPLDQTDCALDIWWLKHGMTAEWVAGAPEEMRKKERQRKEVQHFKPLVSRAFGKVITRGDVLSKDGKLVSVMSPTACNPTSAVAGTSNRFLSDKRFHTWRAVARTDNHKDFLVVCTDWNRVRKVARTDYREWLALTTGDTAGLTDGVLIPLNPSGNGSAPSDIHAEATASSSSSGLKPTTTPPGVINTETPEPERGLTDAQFSAELVQVFKKAQKDPPTRKQIQGVIATLVDQPASRHAFVVMLQEKARRLRNAGILPTLVVGFNENWEGESRAAPPAMSEEAYRFEVLRDYGEANEAKRADMRELYPYLAEKAASGKP
jgi:hypothetical protein